MKHLQKTLVIISALPAIFPSLAMATSPIQVEDVIPVVRPLKVTQVDSEGTVLGEQHGHPYSTFIIGIKVQVDPQDACTELAGQVTSKEKRTMPMITVLGSSSPVYTGCVAVIPEPITKQLTYRFKVLTGGFVPAPQLQTTSIYIDGAGAYELTLNLGTKEVKVQSMKSHK